MWVAEIEQRQKTSVSRWMVSGPHLLCSQDYQTLTLRTGHEADQHTAKGSYTLKDYYNHHNNNTFFYSKNRDAKNSLLKGCQRHLHHKERKLFACELPLRYIHCPSITSAVCLSVDVNKRGVRCQHLNGRAKSRLRTAGRGSARCARCACAGNWRAGRHSGQSKHSGQK